VLTLVLILAVVWLGLMGLLAIWTIFFQGYIYTEPVSDIQWRAPAAGTAVALYLVLLVYLDYRAPGEYGALHTFTIRKDDTFDEFHLTTQEGNEEDYKKAEKDNRGNWVYRLNGESTGHLPPSTRPAKVTVKENGADLVFEPDTDAKGKFKPSPDGWLYYRDKKTGRYMQEGYYNVASKYQTGKLIVNLLLNFGHFVVWVVVLWLLLQYQFWHAFGLALVAWAAITLLLLPPVISRTEALAEQRSLTSSMAPGYFPARMCMMSPSCTGYVLPSSR
jgi:hypothetical protein